MEKQESVSETQGNCILHVHGALRWTEKEKFQNKTACGKATLIYINLLNDAYNTSNNKK